MLLQIKRERWQCQVTAWAMALEMDVDELMAEIGHDGSEIIWPHMPEPACRRGHHTQECLAVALRYGDVFMPVERSPMLASGYGVVPYVVKSIFGEPAYTRFDSIVEANCGVLQGITNTGIGHSVAYNCGHIFDPDGATYPYHDYKLTPTLAWIRK